MNTSKEAHVKGPVNLEEWQPSQYFNSNMGKLENSSYESGIHMEGENVIIGIDMQFGSFSPNPLSFYIPVIEFISRGDEIRKYTSQLSSNPLSGSGFKEEEGYTSVGAQMFIEELHRQICNSTVLVFHFFEKGMGGEGWEWEGEEVKPFIIFLEHATSTEDLLPILKEVEYNNPHLV